MAFAFNDDKTKYDLTDIIAAKEAIGDMKVYGYVNVTNGSSKVFNFTGTMRGILIAEGNAANSAGVYLINGSSSRYAADAVKNASNLTVTVASGTVTVSSSAGSACHVWLICLEGSGSWAS